MVLQRIVFVLVVFFALLLGGKVFAENSSYDGILNPVEFSKWEKYPIGILKVVEENGRVDYYNILHCINPDQTAQIKQSFVACKYVTVNNTVKIAIVSFQYDYDGYTYVFVFRGDRYVQHSKQKIKKTAEGKLSV